MEDAVEIKISDWSEIKPIWVKELWPLRSPEEISPTSSMKFMGGYDLEIRKNRPYFWKLENSQGDILGTISGFVTGPGQFRSRGIWVADGARGLGYSKLLFKQLEIQARYLDCGMIWSYPRMSALYSYIKAGFVTAGEIKETDDPYSPHIYVEKVL